MQQSLRPRLTELDSADVLQHSCKYMDIEARAIRDVRNLLQRYLVHFWQTREDRCCEVLTPCSGKGSQKCSFPPRHKSIPVRLSLLRQQMHCPALDLRAIVAASVRTYRAAPHSAMQSLQSE